MSAEHQLVSTGDTRVIEALRPMITPERLAKIERVLEHRTYNLSVVMEAIYDHGNSAAVLRSADAMGVQRVNMVLTSRRYKHDRKISLGSEKWLDVYRYHDPVSCVKDLQAQGYRVLATHLDRARPIGEIDFSEQKTALVFGNEKDGVSDEMMSVVDGSVVIPMRGFAQSYNISVAAALGIYHATQDRIRRLGKLGDLTDEEKQILRERFYRRSIRKSDIFLNRVLSES